MSNQAYQERLYLDSHQEVKPSTRHRCKQLRTNAPAVVAIDEAEALFPSAAAHLSGLSGQDLIVSHRTLRHL